MIRLTSGAPWAQAFAHICANRAERLGFLRFDFAEPGQRVGCGAYGVRASLPPVRCLDGTQHLRCGDTGVCLCARVRGCFVKHSACSLPVPRSFSWVTEYPDLSSCCCHAGSQAQALGLEFVPEDLAIFWVWQQLCFRETGPGSVERLAYEYVADEVERQPLSLGAQRNIFLEGARNDLKEIRSGMARPEWAGYNRWSQEVRPGSPGPSVVCLGDECPTSCRS